MKTVERRLDRLEGRLARQAKKPFLIVVTGARQKIPDGLNAAQLERYLREHGAIPDRR